MPRGITRTEGAPSPFTRIGPGRLRSPVPGFGAPGGDAPEGYDTARGGGIWALDAEGLWRDCTCLLYTSRIRGKATDIGELDRVVISLMQQLDLVRPAGLIIAASNVPDELDLALRRRFELSIEFPAPSPSALMEYSKKLARSKRIPIVNGVSQKLASAKTFAAAEQILSDEHRRRILRGV